MERVGQPAAGILDLSGKGTITALSPIEGVSDKYAFASTGGILEIFRDHGWMPVGYKEKRVRVKEHQGTQAHCVVLANATIDGEAASTLPRIMLKNSHDATGSLRLLSGLFERICANGLVVGASADDVRIRHVSLDESAIRTGITRVIESLHRAMGLSDKMKARKVERIEQLDYAARIIEMAWDKDKYVVSPESLIWNHRRAQSGPTLWNTFNSVQEHVIRGGVRQRRADGTSIRSRQVMSIDRSIELNQAMWDVAEAML